ncbi:MAG: PQQ-dependent sugar dehydrogenase, partial [bacterium]|nr:PQQ-dependent sugar dehydrogenase [bacterium]
PPPEDITKYEGPSNTTDFPLLLPPDFSIEIFAKDLPGARVMAFDGEGSMWVSQTSEGKISVLGIKDGKVINQGIKLENLKNPHGLTFDSQNSRILYFAEENKISYIDLQSTGARKIADLPSGKGHFTRTIRLGPDDRLYVSIGSSCNVCNEKDQRRAAIYSMNKDGSDFKPYATGLRNAVFFDWSYVDGRMWATEMGRDQLGDDLPPDEINLVIEGGDYGWPNCYGQRIFDDKFNGDGSCHDIIPPEIDLPAHSAPLGLAFIPEEGWPEAYWYDLLVAFHGSWNRSEPTGYKIVRIKLDDKGNYEGTEDFITGWLTKDGALGRPVDILVQPGGVMYISDDKAGVIYKVTYHGQ